MHLILTGATELVGSGILDAKIKHSSRCQWRCFWALCISKSKVTKEEYVEYTKDEAVAAARAFSSLSCSEDHAFRFVYEGATQELGQFTAAYARTKGETEVADDCAVKNGMSWTLNNKAIRRVAGR
ncbi:hypothetical protein M440DRAFT_1465087 [Trichoderma longibrachiatum ATCC 18648]|uniref:Uncharacterized protein n=1 Tax=Trichoderma longibrachiatum ATCC 18648 TaxID=983965 RepID=A0A2T4BUK5_TRILO|nr:hypothetical protein M440DRAFT_1465087 [Trichoderma longibrachiatum ATCC 18648]